MKALVIYESMYGNTHLIADAIGTGLSEVAEVVVIPVREATPALLHDADLIVVGGPTHAHGVSRPATRQAAADAAEKPGSELVVEPDAAGTGLRDWFSTLDWMSGRAAAFDTRLDAPAPFTGRASKGITRMLRHHGFTVVTEPQSFLVTKANHLEADEAKRARDWGVELAAMIGVLTTG
ncbi:MAG: flavodoxin domain-containing protein [Acidimicrobiales bacterium]